MKKLLTIAVMIFLTTTSATAANLADNSGDRYNDLTFEYFYGKNSTVSDDVKKIIAADTLTSPRVLKILSHDTDKEVSLLAKKSLHSIIIHQ